MFIVIRGIYLPIQVTVSQDYYVKVHKVGATIGQGNIYTSSSFAIIGGSSLIKIPIFIAVSPSYVGVSDIEDEHFHDPACSMAAWR